MRPDIEYQDFWFADVFDLTCRKKEHSKGTVSFAVLFIMTN